MFSHDVRAKIRPLLKRAGLAAVPEPVALAACALACCALAWAVWRFWPRSEAGVALTRADASTAVTSAPDGAALNRSAEASAEVWVHVVGAVRHPGVQRLASGTRVADAVEAAGGLLGNAAADGVNLARVVQDGEQIVVPTRDQWAAGGPTASASGDARAGPGGGKVDINSADVARLDTLPGVGPATAQRIVTDREANGPFASVEDLGRVPGIGEKKLDALKDLICVR